MTEEWRAIAGFEGRYEVSNLGRVRSLRFRNKQTDKLRAVPVVLSPGENKGYFLVALDRKTESVHRLVLLAFRGPPPPGLVAGHLDGNPKNNRIENLAWISQKENQAHRKIHGTHLCGEENPTSKLTANDIREIRAKRKQGASLLSLAKVYGVAGGTISNIALRKSWKHVPEALDGAE